MMFYNLYLCIKPKAQYMESYEKYLEKYLLKKKELEQKGELWRLRISQEEFFSEINRLREYETDAKIHSKLNEFHIQRNIEGTISTLLMETCTVEEMRGQMKKLNETSEKEFAEDAPMVREQLKSIKTPLKFRDAANIYRWIFRKQISIEILPDRVRDEFVNTHHYVILKRNKKL